MKYEVRCGSDPQKLLGWLAAGDDRSTCFVLTRSLHGAPTTACDVTLSLKYFDPDDGRAPYRCLKADDVSIETLRRIPGFVEAAHE